MWPPLYLRNRFITYLWAAIGLISILTGVSAATADSDVAKVLASIGNLNQTDSISTPITNTTITTLDNQTLPNGIIPDDFETDVNFKPSGKYIDKFSFYTDVLLALSLLGIEKLGYNAQIDAVRLLGDRLEFKLAAGRAPGAPGYFVKEGMWACKKVFDFFDITNDYREVNFVSRYADKPLSGLGQVLVRGGGAMKDNATDDGFVDLYPDDYGDDGDEVATAISDGNVTDSSDPSSASSRPSESTIFSRRSRRRSSGAATRTTPQNTNLQPRASEPNAQPTLISITDLKITSPRTTFPGSRIFSSLIDLTIELARDASTLGPQGLDHPVYGGAINYNANGDFSIAIGATSGGSENLTIRKVLKAVPELGKALVAVRGSDRWSAVEFVVREGKEKGRGKIIGNGVLQKGRVVPPGST